MPRRPRLLPMPKKSSLGDGIHAGSQKGRVFTPPPRTGFVHQPFQASRSHLIEGHARARCKGITHDIHATNIVFSPSRIRSKITKTMSIGFERDAIDDGAEIGPHDLVTHREASTLKSFEEHGKFLQLAVVDDRDPPVKGVHRLITGGPQIDDTRARVFDADRARYTDLSWRWDRDA